MCITTLHFNLCPDFFLCELENASTASFEHKIARTRYIYVMSKNPYDVIFQENIF